MTLEPGDPPHPVPMSRRRALTVLGGAGLGVVLAGCSASGSSEKAGSSSRPPGTTPSAVGGASRTRAATCVLSPEVMEGPFYVDLGLVRSDITEGKPGTPLDLRITVVDADTCAAIKGAGVDVWHCDADGVYSAFGGAGAPGGGGSTTDASTFLRGVQSTDANGTAEFRTIYPGWYPARTAHVHVKVHLGGSVVHTGQLFFDDDLTDRVYTRDPYAGHGARDTRNDADSLYGQAGAKNAELAIGRRRRGYVGAITVGVQRS